MKRAIALVLLCACAGQTHAADGASPPSREWLELTYDVNYQDPYTTEEVRVKGDYGWRANGRVTMAPHTFIWGSYDYQLYDTQDSYDYTRERFVLGKYGAGTEFPVGGNALLAFRLSWQEHYGKGFQEVPMVGTARYAYAARGFGYAADLTLPLAGGAEISASYEIAPLTSKAGEYSYKERFKTAAVQVGAPLSPALKLTLGLEQARFTDAASDLTIEQSRTTESILLGLRFAL